MNIAAKTSSLETPDYSVSVSGRQMHIKASGEWSLHTIGDIDEPFTKAVTDMDHDRVIYDFSGITRLDTAGAYVLSRAIRGHGERKVDWDVTNNLPGHGTLIEAAADAAMGRPAVKTKPWYDVLARVGEATSGAFQEAYETLAFLGKFMAVLLRQFLHPTRIRWKSVFALIEDVGLNAAPIIMILSFFIGAVIAFMGAELLASFGAQVFMVDLVGFSVFREFAVLITAIMLAGRSDSAFTAQLGSMKMRQEIDAMTVIGLDTFETLVAPRALACLVSAPILTFAAMISGVFGGMLVAWLGPTDISPILFFARLREAVDISNFWVGMVKSPFFAIIIAAIGCRQGLAVEGSVESLGARTTQSVVQSIFAVIVVDAMFAMLFLEMGV